MFINFDKIIKIYDFEKKIVVVYYPLDDHCVRGGRAPDSFTV